MTLYDRIKATGAKLDHHESDLYFEATPEARRIMAEEMTRQPFVGDAVTRRTWSAVREGLRLLLGGLALLVVGWLITCGMFLL